jgi:hypothetical protein
MVFVACPSLRLLKMYKPLTTQGGFFRLLLLPRNLLALPTFAYYWSVGRFVPAISDAQRLN